MMTSILASIGVAYCTIWTWVAVDPEEGLLFTSRHLGQLPAALRPRARLMLHVPMEVQSTPECERLREEGAGRHPILGREEIEIEINYLD